MRISVIDVQRPGDVPETVPVLDELGYHRYWATEHHGPWQSGSPTLMAALAGGLSTRIRIGTMGILLPLTSPLKAAEDFSLLELFYPGRIDAGISSALPADARGTLLRDGRPILDPAGYAQRVEHLVRLLRRDESIPPEERAGPTVETVPQIWICGMSEHTARLAGRLGLGFAFSEHFRLNGRTVSPGRPVVDAYRESFRPSRDLAQPLDTIACYGLCAPEPGAAEKLWGSSPWTRELVPTFLGTPAECREQLAAIAAGYGAEELTLQSLADDLGDRLTSYRLLAEVLGLDGKQ